MKIATEWFAAYQPYVNTTNRVNRDVGAVPMYFWSYSFTWPPIGLLLIHWLLVLMILMFFGFLPSLIAFVRGHHNRYAILVLNLLLGWTLIGWAVALVWSLTAVWRQSPPAAYET